ncbi:MAG: hypothetical protein KDH96_03540 [Candidatus Riesia sp.]|nr:hypothetical protein [Candidatus Riesia sp.]
MKDIWFIRREKSKGENYDNNLQSHFIHNRNYNWIASRKQFDSIPFTFKLTSFEKKELFNIVDGDAHRSDVYNPVYPLSLNLVKYLMK